MNGFINVLKPTGMTSHDVVQVIRRMVGQKKVGHTGTLDPMAAGVLPVGLGTATRITEYLDRDFKKYRCEMILGVRSETGDIWGSSLEKQEPPRFSEPEILEMEKLFRGEIRQVPPMYSAVRVAGRRLYEYARSGEDVAVKARKVTIRELKILRYDRDRILFDVDCSKGTYVRTICTEIGEKLGCGGAMSFLARTRSGAFSMEDSMTFEELQDYLDSGTPPEEWLLPVDFPIRDYPKAELETPEARVFINGGYIKLPQVKIGSEEENYYRVYRGDVFLAMATIDKHTKQLVPHKVFYRDLNGGTNL